jgi:hypothetical protein
MFLLESTIIGHYIGKYIVNAIVGIFQFVFLIFKSVFLILKYCFCGISWLIHKPVAIKLK